MVMSKSQIPNLNSLRRGNARLRGRDDGIGFGTGRSNDAIVKDTDRDAATSRLSAVHAGYLDDPFAPLLTTGDISRRLPLMNRGTYTRTQGIDRIVQAFLRSCPGRAQIISLGAGSDTRYLRLRQANRSLDILYHEIDFETNVKAKTERLIASSAEIERLTGVQLTMQGGQLKCRDYFIHARDLRTLKIGENLPGMEAIPTLLISECCLIYLSPDEAQEVLRYFTTSLSTSLAIAIYEPIRPHDAFGRTMVQNLVGRGIHLRTLQEYADLEDQQRRLNEYGFTSRAADTHLIWQKWIDNQEKERIDSLEWLDEIEEFVLLAKHYCICWGWRGFGGHTLLEDLVVK